ncbi:MAG: hypothetical protein HFG43_11955 [Lachnospiraceae bacterium]|nr:hypothetical protein [Lachnospiraceae bacterium]
MNKKELDFWYKQSLEQSMIEYLSEIKNLELRQAMDIYYKSELSEQIEKGLMGIENLDYKYLVEDLLENEKGLFS